MKLYALVVFMFFVIVIITAISNGANITDGIDGLATGTSAIIGITLAILAYVSGNGDSRLPEYYVHPQLGRAGNFCGCICWGLCRLFVVQLLPGPGFYGRYRQLGHWRYYSGICHYDT
jgi:UDP-N-acetylmuramyl pentapeptide phosphotransferase/UDP-N-acetylglucosamine-1-phosphate transferase